MPKYLLRGKYSVDGMKGLIENGGTKRREAVERALDDVGVKSEAFYYAFGETDIFCIVDAPDNVTVAALSLSVNAAGADNLKVTVLLTAEELDLAIRKSASYLPPSRQ